jgi:hypothetical protein
MKNDGCQIGANYCMTKVKVNYFNISLDGFAAGPNQSEENPLGENGDLIFQWFFKTRAFREMRGIEPGKDTQDDALRERSHANTGAEIMGRNKFGPIRGNWPDESWRG